MIGLPEGVCVNAGWRGVCQYQRAGGNPIPVSGRRAPCDGIRHSFALASDYSFADRFKAGAELHDRPTSRHVLCAAHMSPQRHAAQCLSGPLTLLSAGTGAYGPAKIKKTEDVMPPHTTTSALFIALLLAGTSSVVSAEPKDATAPLFDAAEIERAIEIGFLLDLNPASQPFEPDNRFGLATGATSAVPRVAGKPAFGAEETQSAIARSIKSGLPVSTDTAALPAQLNRGLAITDQFKAGVKAGFDAPMGDDMRLKAAAVETELSLGRIAPSMSWGWFTELDMQTQRDGTNAVASGPQFKLGGDSLALTLKPKVAHTFRANHADEVAFAYAAGLKGELAKGVALGIEAFGSTSDVVTAPGMGVPTHRGSPTLYVGLGLMPPLNLDASASQFSLEVGAITGMTESDRDLTGRIKAAVTW